LAVMDLTARHDEVQRTAVRAKQLERLPRF
jgi:hypothetical protein